MSKYGLKKDKKFLISEEAAVDQVVRLLGYYDIDVDRLTSGDDSEMAAKFEMALDSVRDYFRTGQLELGEADGSKLTVIHHLRGGDTLTYGEVSSKAKIAMERFDPQAGYSRLYAFMGALCGIGKGAIEKLGPQDLSVVEVLGTVFLNA